MEEAGLLALDARVMIPMHVDVATTLFGTDPRSELLWKRLCRVFRPSILPLHDDQLLAEHPLWAATQAPGTLVGLTAHDRDDFRGFVARYLEKWNAARPEKYTNGTGVFHALRNELGWKNVKPFPAFVVLTRR
jgi:hypothetical protein